MEENVEVAFVEAVVEQRDESLVLLCRAHHLKAMDRAVVGLSHQLRPLAPRRFSVTAICRQIQQMFPAIRITQRVHLGLIH